MAVPVTPCTILMFDLKDYSSAERTRDDVVALKKGFHVALVAAFADAGVHWDELRYETSGDSYLVLVPVQFVKSVFVERFPHSLAEAVRVYNARNRKQAQMRLRMALHAGEVADDPHGVTSPAINKTKRLVDAPALKDALAKSDGVLALIVSAYIYDEVVRPSEIAAAQNFREVQIKRISERAWISLPEDPYPPKKHRSAVELRIWFLVAVVAVVAVLIVSVLVF